ncbi:MAG: transcriptional repressor [Pseudomonadota bacterium]
MRVTRPRLLIAELLFGDGEDRHVTAEWVAEELERAGESIALASVYNTLHSFVGQGLLRPVQSAERGVTMFDTNTRPHHHVYNETTGELSDIADGDLKLAGEPTLPDGVELVGTDIVIRVR